MWTTAIGRKHFDELAMQIRSVASAVYIHTRMTLNLGFCYEEDELVFLINIFMNINGQPDVDLLPIAPYTRIWSGWETNAACHILDVVV